MNNIGYRFYFLFIVCNLTNALFFYFLLPETARRPLEEMNYMFSRAPWIVAGRSRDSYVPHDLEHRINSIEDEKGLGKQGEVASSHNERPSL